MKRSTSHLIAFATGAAAGLAFGILYAPDKGSNTRDKLSYKLHKYKGKLEELIGDLVKGKDVPSSEAKSEGQRLINEAKEKAEKLLSDVDDLIGQIKGRKDFN